MLYQFGGLQFTVWPFNVHGIDRDASYDFAAHPVVGARQPLEAVGPGEDRIVLEGRLFPHKLGGLSALEALRRMAEAQQPQPLMRGDGTPFGWRVVANLGERGSHLDGRGIGRLIEFEATFALTPRPAASAWYGSLVSLFG
jgi:phage protein U